MGILNALRKQRHHGGLFLPFIMTWLAGAFLVGKWAAQPCSAWAIAGRVGLSIAITTAIVFALDKLSR
jgi:hypothetical protein